MVLELLSETVFAFFYQLGQEPPKENPDSPGTMNPGMWWEHVLFYS